MRKNKAEYDDESDSERERVRKRAKKRKFFAALVVVIIIAALGFLVELAVKSAMDYINRQDVVETKVEYTPTIEIVDEGGRGKVSNRVKEYVAKFEEDVKELGRKATRAVLPVGTAREVDFYIEGANGYVKTNIDRGTAVSAEDTVRMLKYLEEKGISEFSYIDVRVAGKGYYK